MFNTDEGHRKIATAVQEMWKRHLNVDIALASQDWKVHMDAETNMHYQISRASWIGDYVDPATFLDLFLTGSGNNRTGWSNGRYDELIARASRNSDRDGRHDFLRQAERILMDEVPIVPIYVYTQVRLLSPDLRGWEHNILDQHPYKYLWLADPAAAAKGPIPR
jgi:oligopeptide transport system substrate-binding protein